jgi:diguanylate cyclase (GGDEF)-like protein
MRGQTEQGFFAHTMCGFRIERLREKISKHNFEKDGIKTNITISIGLGTNRAEFKTEDEIIKDADTMLYESKQNGRNRTTIYGGVK